MNIVQAIDHELQSPRVEKLEAMLMQLGDTPANEIELTETVRQYDGS